ncbi:MAG: lytic transglycosylase domain-containing protein [Candidatus Adiutrix sp.]|nr:lytic transglycosylase domain-containing protein [Candidatus Adiutrix sp.]
MVGVKFLGVFFLALTLTAWPVISLARVEPEPGRIDYRLPVGLTLCGETLDLTRPLVYERLEAEFIRVVNHPAQVALWQRRAKLYFPYIEAELKAAGLPDDLKYLAVAESDLRPWIVSPAGALGLWQFMPTTAREYGLVVNKKNDQRQLPEPLLGAAISYFKALKARFGSWPLALAAYNAGQARLSKAVASQGTRDYFSLDLPRETERYVYRIAAIKAVMANAGAYGLGDYVSNEPGPGLHYRPARFTERPVTVTAGGHWSQLARELGCDYKILRMLNPNLRQPPAAGSQVLRLPVDF